VLILAITAALAGCGRRGALEEPVASAPAPNEIVAAPVGPIAPNLSPDQRVVFDDQGRPTVRSINQPAAAVPDAGTEKREFFLDPLLD
jgi:predicted small lipoprotein YifL